MKFRDFSDTIFKTIFIFAISFFWINYYIKNFIKTFFLSLLISFLLIIIIRFFENKKSTKLNTSKTDKKNIENIKLQLIFNSNKNNKIYFQKLLNLNNKMQLTIESKIYMIFPLLNSNILTEKDISKIYKTCLNLGIYNAVIICSERSLELTTFASNINNINIKIVDIQTLYFNFIKPQNFYPEKIITLKESSKYKLKELIKIFFKQENYKKFLKLGFLTYFLSFFTMFRIYYLISGTVLLIFSAICKFSKNNESKPFTFQ